MPADDAQILSLFRQWVAAERAAAAIARCSGERDAQEDPEFVRACDRIYDLLREIADIPAAGPQGFVAKAYLHQHIETGGTDKARPRCAGRARATTTC
jgi:hypothetical protein